MKPETQGKLMVAMLVSILAFGFGTGSVLVTGHLQTKPSITLNTTQQSDFPSISNSRQNDIRNTSTSNSPIYDQNNNHSTSYNNTSYNN